MATEVLTQVSYYHTKLYLKAIEIYKLRTDLIRLLAQPSTGSSPTEHYIYKLYGTRSRIVRMIAGVSQGFALTSTLFKM